MVCWLLKKKCLISCDFHRWQVGPVVQRSGVSQDFISPRCNNLEINKASLIKKESRYSWLWCASECVSWRVNVWLCLVSRTVRGQNIFWIISNKEIIVTWNSVNCSDTIKIQAAPSHYPWQHICIFTSLLSILYIACPVSPSMYNCLLKSTPIFNTG